MRTAQLMFIAAAAGLAATATVAQDREPDWVKRPTYDDLAAVWPARALKEGYGGKAIISCIVTLQGALRACHVVEETPEGGGFGAAALALSPQFLMRPALKGGVPTEAPVRIPITFPRPDRATGSHLKPTTDTAFPGDRIFTRLPWRKAPTVAQVLAAYPQGAKAEKIGGAAVLDCRIDKDGGLSACRVLKETPDGKGFGAAARSLAPFFETPTVDSKGASIAGGRTHLDVTFAAEALDHPAIGRPNWTAMPAMEDFTAVLPPAARAAKVYRARVVMTCTVAADGALGDCRTEAEEPAGLGYREAALQLSRYFRVGVWTDEGLPTVGGTLRIPLRFDLEAAMAAKAQP